MSSARPINAADPAKATTAHHQNTTSSMAEQELRLHADASRSVVNGVLMRCFCRSWRRGLGWVPADPRGVQRVDGAAARDRARRICKLLQMLVSDAAYQRLANSAPPGNLPVRPAGPLLVLQQHHGAAPALLFLLQNQYLSAGTGMAFRN